MKPERIDADARKTDVTRPAGQRHAHAAVSVFFRVSYWSLGSCRAQSFALTYSQLHTSWRQFSIDKILLFCSSYIYVLFRNETQLRSYLAIISQCIQLFVCFQWSTSFVVVYISNLLVNICTKIIEKGSTYLCTAAYFKRGKVNLALYTISISDF